MGARKAIDTRPSGRFIAPGIVVAGLLVTGLSWVWPLLHLPGSGWSEQQAKDYVAAGAEMHRLSGAVAAETANTPEDGTLAPVSSPTNDDLAAAQARFNHLQAALEEARTRPQRIAAVLRWVGVGAILAGIVGVLAVRTHA